MKSIVKCMINDGLQSIEKNKNLIVNLTFIVKEKYFIEGTNI